MRRNTGDKIKSWVKFFFILEIIVSVTIGILIGNLLDGGGNGEFVAIAVIIAIFICVMASYFTYLLFAGFGELVSNSHKLVELAEEAKEI